MTIRISFSDKLVRVAVEIDGKIESAITELPDRTWVGLTEDERTAIRQGVQTYLDMTQYEYGKAVQQATELKLMEKNT